MYYQCDSISFFNCLFFLQITEKACQWTHHAGGLVKHDQKNYFMKLDKIIELLANVIYNVNTYHCSYCKSRSVQGIATGVDLAVLTNSGGS